MGNYLTKYSLIMLALGIAFSNFVSCGAKMYQVSLERDHDESKVPSHATNQDSNYYGLHSTEGWRDNLPIKFYVGMSLTESQREGLSNAINTWEQAVGQKLFEFKGTDKKTGDSFKDLVSSLDDGIDAHYADSNWKKTGKKRIVLATTIWDTRPHNQESIRTADIRYNTQYYKIGDAYKDIQREDDFREIVDMETLALHELGHLLGLSHIDPSIDPLSILNPSIYIGEGLANRYLSCGDVERIQKIYGCKGQACNLEATCAKLGGSELAYSDTENEKE